VCVFLWLVLSVSSVFGNEVFKKPKQVQPFFNFDFSSSISLEKYN